MAGGWRVGRFRWIIVMFVAGLCGLSLNSPAPPATAFQLGAPVVAAVPPGADPVGVILGYVEQELGADDPLVQIEEQIWAKTSNVNGVIVGGRLFYYQLLPDTSFDPLSLGLVDPDDISVWRIVDNGAVDVVIYRLNPSVRQRAL